MLRLSLNSQQLKELFEKSEKMFQSLEYGTEADWLFFKCHELDQLFNQFCRKLRHGIVDVAPWYIDKVAIKLGSESVFNAKSCNERALPLKAMMEERIHSYGIIFCRVGYEYQSLEHKKSHMPG